MRKLLLASIIVSLFSFDIGMNELNGDVVATATYTYTSKNCSYDVYRASGGGTIRCNDWNFVGSVTSSNNVSINLNPGDNVIVRIVHGSYGVCEGAKKKREDNLYMKPGTTKSSSTSWELHDWTCP